MFFDVSGHVHPLQQDPALSMMPSPYVTLVAHGELIGVGVLAVIGVVLIALAPAKQAPMDRVAPSGRLC